MILRVFAVVAAMCFANTAQAENPVRHRRGVHAGLSDNQG
jgi:hypothetical protein